VNRERIPQCVELRCSGNFHDDDKKKKRFKNRYTLLLLAAGEYIDTHTQNREYYTLTTTVLELSALYTHQNVLIDGSFSIQNVCIQYKTIKRLKRLLNVIIILFTSITANGK
jgi:hypothetical protein